MTSIRRAASIAAPALASLCLAGCVTSTASSGGGPKLTPKVTHVDGRVITPAQAKAVVTSTMTTNNRANKAFDSKLLATYESGSAFTLDHSTYLQDRLALAAKDPLTAYEPFTVEVSEVGVPGRTGYPFHWLALGTQVLESKSAPATSTCVAALDFSRTSAGQPWRIDIEPSLPASLTPKLAIGKDGYVASPGGRGFTARVDALPGRVVAALRSEELTGKLGPFTKSDFTRQCGAIPNPRVDVESGEAEGLDARDTYAVDRGTASSAYALTGGRALVLFTLNFDDEVTAGADTPLSWSHKATKADPAPAYEYLLPVGDYSHVSESGELEIAAVLSPSGSYSIVGSYSGITAITGTKATATPTGTTPGTLTAFVSR